MCQLHANSRADPTRTLGYVRTFMAKVRKQQARALAEVRDFIDTIPYTTRTIQENRVVNRKVYQYDTTNIDYNLVIAEIIARWYGTSGQRPPPRWFFDGEVERVVRTATLNESQRINQLTMAMGLGEVYAVQQILLSQPYLSRITTLRSRVFEEMKGFSGDTARALARTLSDEMALGNGIRSVKARISEQFGEELYRAERIARTEFGNAHRMSKMAQTIDSRDRLGLDSRTQLISALAPTTRPSHADLHLRIVQPEQVEGLYARTQGGRINCLCDEQTVIVTQDGEVLGQRKMTKRDKAEIERIKAGK